MLEPLDAHETAKPDEPTFTLQGGDPFGWVLVQLWAHFARLRAGVMSPAFAEGIFKEITDAALSHKAETEKDGKELLVRATEAEKVAWDMKAYLKGEIGAQAETSGEKILGDELDLLDVRMRGAGRISSAISDLWEIKEGLQARGFEGEILYVVLDVCIDNLKSIYNTVQYRKDRHFPNVSPLDER